MIKDGKISKSLLLSDKPTKTLLMISKEMNLFGKNGMIMKDLNSNNFLKVMENLHPSKFFSF